MKQFLFIYIHTYGTPHHLFWGYMSYTIVNEMVVSERVEMDFRNSTLYLEIEWFTHIIVDPLFKSLNIKLNFKIHNFDHNTILLILNI